MDCSEMHCTEKQSLQEKCVAAWKEYQTAKAEPVSAGVSFDPQSGQLTVPAAKAAMLRWNHLQASSALSRHLSRHRC